MSNHRSCYQTRGQGPHGPHLKMPIALENTSDLPEARWALENLLMNLQKGRAP